MLPEHAVGNKGMGRLFFLPGSDGRARRISERFSQTQILHSDRQLNVYLGTLTNKGKRIEVGAVSTGMGCASLDIVVTELILIGVRLFIRVGTAGSLQPDTVRTGHLVLATGGVRNEGSSERYIPKCYPAISDPDMLNAMQRAATQLGLADHTYKGIVHSKDSLYGMEFDYSPMREANHAYIRQLQEMGVLATEMESSHLFILSHIHSSGITPISQTNNNQIKSGTILAIIGDHSPFSSATDDIQRAEQDAIDLATQTAYQFFYPRKINT